MGIEVEIVNRNQSPVLGVLFSSPGLLLRLPANEVIHDGNQAVQLLGGLRQRRFCSSMRRAGLAKVVRNEDLGAKQLAVFFFMVEKHLFVFVQAGLMLGLNLGHPSFVLCLLICKPAEKVRSGGGKRFDAAFDAI
jgi:hypothetical protein